MKPLLTVVVPVYNAEKYLDTVLNCLVNQTYENKEIILVDDGATDSSPRICDEYSEKYDYIRVIHKENGGVHTARNTGLEAANGEYVSFIDSDDWMDYDFYEVFMDALMETQSDFAACGYKTEYCKKFELGYKSDVKPIVTTVEGAYNCLSSIDSGTTAMAGFVWNKVFKKSVIGELRFRSDIPICDDLFFVYEFAAKANKGCYIDRTMYHYRYVADGLSKKSPMQRYVNCLRGMKRLCEWSEINANHCLDEIYTNYIFWNTKSCEHMINDYDEAAYKEIQANLLECQAYIEKCGFRIKLLAKKILISWKAYRRCGLFFWKLKQLYVKGKNIL